MLIFAMRQRRAPYLCTMANQFDVAVVGGGAAGFFAAIHAGMAGASTALLEKTGKVLAKVKVSGGGRCNVTHACFDPKELVKNYPRGGRELLGAFHRFHCSHTIDWFEQRGVRLHTEGDGRMFPTTNDSQTIIDCLQTEARRHGVRQLLNTAVQKTSAANNGFQLETSNGPIMARKVIIAAGGHPKLDGLSWLQALGHELVPPVPSLFTFNLPQAKELRSLMGLATNAQVSLPAFNHSWQGPVLITHWGLSGPAVLKLSAWLARELAAINYQTTVEVNWLNRLEAEVLAELKQLRDANPGKHVANFSLGLPRRLWEYLVWRAALPERLTFGQAGNKHLAALVAVLCRDRYEMHGKTTFKDEFVTAGGVALHQINFKTMESRLVPGLYFAGEVLDIDAITGGFNFQAAWTTGYLAGEAAALAVQSSI